MHDVAACKAEFALQSLGAEDLAAQNRRAKAGGMRLDCVDDAIGGCTFFCIPIAGDSVFIGGQFRRKLLAPAEPA